MYSLKIFYSKKFLNSNLVTPCVYIYVVCVCACVCLLPSLYGDFLLVVYHISGTYYLATSNLDRLLIVLAVLLIKSASSS